MSEICRQLQSKGRSGTLEGVPELADRLEREYQKVLEELGEEFDHPPQGS